MAEQLYRFTFLFMLLCGVLLFVSCDKKNDELWNAEKIQIINYLQTAGISDFVEDPASGYFYYFTDLDSISGGRPNVNSKVELRYRLEALDGSFYHQTPIGETEKIDLSQSIVGWQLGLPNFFIGSKGYLILPSRLAYGKKGYFNEYGDEIIPPNTILVFYIELIEVHPHF